MALLALAACASQRAHRWNERGEDFLRSQSDHRIPPVTESALAEMASPGFDWDQYWSPRPHELPTKYGKAAHDFARAVEIQPGVPRYHLNLGISLLGLRDPGRAEESFRRALALEPDNHAAALGLTASEAALRARAQPAVARRR